MGSVFELNRNQRGKGRGYRKDSYTGEFRFYRRELMSRIVLVVKPSLVVVETGPNTVRINRGTKIKTDCGCVSEFSLVQSEDVFWEGSELFQR